MAVENPELVSALAAVCYTVENQIDDEAGRKVWYRHCDDSLAAGAADNNYVGSLLREAGVANTSMLLLPHFVQATVVESLSRLCAVLVQLRNPRHNHALRWLVAYGVGPQGLFTMVCLEPGESNLEQTELWPNVTGQIVLVNESAPHALRIELVDLSADIVEEETFAD